MRPLPSPPVPAATAALARAVFPAGCLATRLRDEIGEVFTNADFTDGYPHQGGPALSPATLALVSVLQYAERLTDRQAAHAAAARIDWKYALGFELADTGFDHSVLSQFRDRLIENGLVTRVLELLLDRCAELGLLRVGGRVRTDATHVVACVRALNRLEFVTETLRAALEALAVAAPGWLAEHDLVSEAWVRRYGARADYWRLPKGEAERAAFAVTVGADGFELLDAVAAEAEHDGVWRWLADIPAVALLRGVWDQQYVRDRRRTVRQRTGKELPPGAQRIVSPYDPDARVGIKRSTRWDGYKLHLTESCDADGTTPHLITHVVTAAAPVDDAAQTLTVEHDLLAAGRAPVEHLVDAGYMGAELIVEAAHLGIDLVGPVPIAGGRQEREGRGYALGNFTIDWDAHTATCPQGKTSTRWIDTKIDGHPRIHVDFYNVGCPTCPAKPDRTSARFRGLTLHPREEHEALQRRRREQETEPWRQRYAARAGVEGTIAQAIQACDARRTRYRGLPKVTLEHVLLATAINLIRLDAWWTGTPLGPTRTSHYTRLELDLAA
ncbi:IS1182 family transposase [Catenulispora sp. MAP5-51]|uniref:IS1182 family transposase n=1 Tax=Catenulispora sp. MAP5-51 TaxID=3156298 RepID=UPI0035112BF9